jgi:dienelactone hydrolase
MYLTMLTNKTHHDIKLPNLSVIAEKIYPVIYIYFCRPNLITMKRALCYSVAISICMLVIACNDQPATPSTEEKTKEVKIKEENVTYTSDAATLKGFVAFDANSDKKRPAILVVHEWWGLTEYPKMRVRQLAELGYIAMAVDMYGNGTVVDSPAAAMRMSGPFYKDPVMAKGRLDAAMSLIKSYPQTDTNNIAAIGYCFGGGMILNTARLGENWKGVVSFHGSLIGTPANKDLLKAKILVCHGAADTFVPQSEVEEFQKQMDSIGADYELKIYAEATHAFTNPAATEVAKRWNMPIRYNAAADTASWNDMKAFFEKIFK